MSSRFRLKSALLALTLWPGLLQARPPAVLGEPPTAPTPDEVRRLRKEGPIVLGPGGSLSVNIASREQVRNFFNTVYAASANFSIGWTGDLGSCAAGTTDSAFRDLVVLRINYVRAMAGVPAGIVLNDVNNGKDQQAALIMSANNQLNHFPPSSWSCYSANGYEAAGNSNIALGNAGPDAIDAYINDYGANNYIVGHRRWLLYPQTQTMGTGDVPATGPNYSANATWVFDSNYGGPRPATRDNFVSWPPPGFVPYQLIYARWSLAYPNADFSSATVTMSTNGVNIPVTRESVTTGYGENTLVWYPSNLNPSVPVDWPRPETDTVYNISLQNVKGAGVPTTFTYHVTAFDPQVPGPDTVLPAVSGPDQPVVNQTNVYTFATVTNATGYQWRRTQRTAFTAVEGAENGLTYFTTNIAPYYSAIVTSPRASGSYAFRLAHAQPDFQTAPEGQTLTYTRVLLPGTNGQLQFKSRLGYAADGEVARVQVSSDGGNSWLDVYTQTGNNNGTQIETSFNSRTVSLSGYAGRTITVRFGYDYVLGLSFYNQSDPGFGWYLDDISFSGTEELTNPVVTNIAPGTSFYFVPAQAGDYSLDVRAQVYDRYYLEWGPAKRVTAILAAVPMLQFSGTPAVSGNQVQIDFTVSNYRSDMFFQLLSAPDPGGAWTPTTITSLQTVVPNSKFRLTTSTGGASKMFYRVQSN